MLEEFGLIIVVNNGNVARGVISGKCLQREH